MSSEHQPCPRRGQCALESVWSHLRRHLALLALFLAPVAVPQLSAAELTPGSLRIGFTKACFRGMNLNDAEASFKVLLGTVGRKHGYAIQSRVAIFDNASAFERAIQDRSLDLMIIDSWHYVRLKGVESLDPAFIPVPREKAGREYLLLARQDDHIGGVADLRGKEFIQLEMGAATMGRPWLDTLLVTQGLGTREGFFGRVEVTHKPSAAVLPVFFGKRQACLVDRLGFDVMRELNPQLGSALSIIAQSESYVDDVVCLAKEGWPSEALRQDTRRTLGELHLEPTGQQILTLFKISRLAPYEPLHLDSVRKLRDLHDRARAEAKL